MNLSSLNKEQRAAVECLDGPLLVLAGAGSGKTRVVTYRIANLIEHGVNAWNILALTFTNKAAKEMKERTAQLVGEKNAEDMWVTTFHAACARILRMHIEELRDGHTRRFIIYDDSDQMSVLDTILKRHGVDEKTLPKRAIKEGISRAKNAGIPLDRYFSEGLYANALECDIAQEYQKELLAANALDFDDLLCLTVRLFEECPHVLERYRMRFRFILVDEYQDTNPPQFRIVKMLCDSHQNICVVGDDDQSIYGWRGADVSNILRFESDFKNVRVIRLEQNYRSTANILNAANAVIANNTNRKSKVLWTTDADGERIKHGDVDTERGESNYICRQILWGIKKKKKYSDYAMLYRTNAQSRVLESTLISYGIPYKVFGGHRFYDRKEVKDIMCYLRLIANAGDDVSFKRIVNLPTRGIGNTTIASLTKRADEAGMSLYETALTDEMLDKRVRDKLYPFLSLMEGFKKMRYETSLKELAQSIIVTINYREHLEKTSNADAQSKWENIMELLGSIEEAENGLSKDDDPLSAFLENVALMSDIDAMNEEDKGYVSLMTLHNAKGLEFDTVFIPGLEDDIFPTSRAKNEFSTLEEERRLMYVGITRARKKLYLINAQSRSLYGNTSFMRESRFISEIPNQLMDIEAGSYGIDVSSTARSTDGSYSIGAAGFSSYTDSSVTSYGSNTYRGLGYIKGRGSQTSSGYQSTIGKTAKPPKPVEKNLTVGQRVRHEKFGDGSVTAVSGSGNAMLVTIMFDSGVSKKLAAAYAPLTSID